MKIGLYGGSFNPVHNGHLAVARTALAELALDRLLVVPAAVSPFKAEVAAGLPVCDRLLLLHLVFDGMERVTVDEREIARGGVSYAIDTVEELVRENPGAELTFVVGEDSVAGLPQWKDYARLRELCAFKVFPRSRESSTEVRARLARGESVDDLVPPSVALFLRHRVRLNPNAKVAAVVRQGLLRKGGYCPCRLVRTEEFRCPCAEFRSQLEDPGYHGPCHCRLYVKP